MIKIYGMPTCPDCVAVEEQIKGREDEFEFIDIGSHVSLLKEFLVLRDNEDVFADVRKDGKAGIPCFVKEDGSITLALEEVGLVAGDAACSIEDHLNGKEGC